MELSPMEKSCCQEKPVKSERKNGLRNTIILAVSIFVSAALLSGAWVYTTQLKLASQTPEALEAAKKANMAELQKKILPESVTLPVKWEDFGKKMIEAGVIDQAKFEAIYESRGGLDEASKKLLAGDGNGEIVMNAQNSSLWLNLLWAFGLGNKNEILEKGEMTNPEYGGAKNFASTGGWTISKGDAMTHYSKHEFVTLTAEQQALVEKVSKGIYRPCCGNSTHFPDCNHGMAMLGLLELMASQGVNEEDMFKAALKVNSYWFPDTYLTIGNFLAKKGLKWEDMKPENLLGPAFSSGSGFAQIRREVEPIQSTGGGGCSV